MIHRIAIPLVWALPGLLLLPAVTSGCDDNPSELRDLQVLQETLIEYYPEYAVQRWPEEMRGYRKSPENFIGDILVGDFNFDGVADFSAKLVRAPNEAELLVVPERHRATIQVVGLIVVCDGLQPVEQSSRFRCTAVSDEQLGGNYSWLDFTEWTISVDALGEEEEVNNNAECLEELKAGSGKKMLSLLQPVGHCDAFLYPISSGGYGMCQYCAD
jgi:hypothetical protein